MTHRTRPTLTCVVLGLGLAGVAMTPAAADGATTTRTRTFNRPPYHHGTPPAAGAVIARLAPTVTAAPDLPDAWIPRPALERLASEIDEFLGDDPVRRLATIPSAAGGSAPRSGRPTVYFGCELDTIGECDTDQRRNVLVTSGGTREWKSGVGATYGLTGGEYLLLVELRLAPQWIAQRGLSGKKEIRLGTDHVQRLAWLSSLDSPVWVLQLTGALIDAEGKVVRSGAEGIVAVRTPFRASMLRTERLLSDAEVEHARTAHRREDLPLAPLAWQEAARRLVHGLIAPPAG